MHNIKVIRQNFDEFKKKISDRNINIDIDKILLLDKENRDLIQKKENLEKEKKEISKKNDKSLFKRSKELSNLINNLTNDQKKKKSDLDLILSNLPNIANSDVPIGKDEKSNKVIEIKGEIRKFDFKPKSHAELGENLNMLDFDLASKTTGTRFVFVKKDLAYL